MYSLHKEFQRILFKVMLKSDVQLHIACHIDFMKFTIQASVLEAAEGNETNRKCDIRI
jgi:hypothetical protein